MTQPVDEARALLEQSLANARALAESCRPDSTYRHAYNNFVNWVIEQPSLATNEPPFITTRNIDEYYTKHIAHVTGSKKM